MGFNRAIVVCDDNTVSEVVGRNALRLCRRRIGKKCHKAYGVVSQSHLPFPDLSCFGNSGLKLWRKVGRCCGRGHKVV